MCRYRAGWSSLLPAGSSLLGDVAIAYHLDSEDTRVVRFRALLSLRLRYVLIVEDVAPPSERVPGARVARAVRVWNVCHRCGMRQAFALVVVAVVLVGCGGGSLEVDDPEGIVGEVDVLAPEALDEFMGDRGLEGRPFASWNRLGESELLVRAVSGQCWDDEYDVDLAVTKVDGLVVFDVGVSGPECEGGDQIGLVVRLTEPISDAEIRVRPSPQCRREGCP